jgi:hypothetical protein
MSGNTENMEKFERYFNGEMSATETEAFEAELKRDPVLKKESEEFEAAMKLVKVAGIMEVKERIGLYRKKYESTTKRQSGVKWMAVAAGIVVLMAISYLLIINKPAEQKHLFASNFEPYSTIAIRGENGDYPEWEAAMALYESGDYQTAYRAFEKIILTDSSFRYPAMFYAALGLMPESNAGNETITRNLNDVINNYPVLHDQAQWYLALWNIKIEKMENAKVLLQEIASNATHYKQEKAKQLLNELN